MTFSNTPGINFGLPSLKSLTEIERIRQNLELNAGIRKQETEKNRLSAQAYTTESVKHIRKQLSDIESDFFKIQAVLNGDKSATQPIKLIRSARKKSKFGDSDDDE